MSKEDVTREAKENELEVVYDPPGLRNLCFYECLGHYLAMDKHIVVGRLEEFLLENQYLKIKNEVRLVNFIHF